MKYEIISIGINKGANPIGTPDGKKYVKNLNPCLNKAIIVTPIENDSCKCKRYGYLRCESITIWYHS